MKVKFSVGEPLTDPGRGVNLDIIPKEGSTVVLPDGKHGRVYTVDWYPWGSDDDRTPYVEIRVEISTSSFWAGL